MGAFLYVAHLGGARPLRFPISFLTNGVGKPSRRYRATTQSMLDGWARLESADNLTSNSQRMWRVKELIFVK
ncbi:hypothetical protein DXK94_08010 [Arthrobacter sp. RT-1]|nr:hypothetical protein DXK94_08010 [Arthrobacter sp. RT-1]